jgi:hypothetical protein
MAACGTQIAGRDAGQRSAAVAVGHRVAISPQWVAIHLVDANENAAKLA